MHIFEHNKIKVQPRIEELNCNDEMMYRGYSQYVLCHLSFTGVN